MFFKNISKNRFFILKIEFFRLNLRKFYNVRADLEHPKNVSFGKTNMFSKNKNLKLTFFENKPAQKMEQVIVFFACCTRVIFLEVITQNGKSS